MVNFRDEEDAADARHDTPPRKPNHFVHDSLGDPETCTGDHNHPPEATPASYLRRQLDRGLLHPELAGAIRVLLARLDSPLHLSNPGLAYADPLGAFACNPALPKFTGDDLSTVELRVMAAYLATALDNVNAALKRRSL